MKNCQTCIRCLYSSNHPLGLTFNELGLCSGCQIHEEKDQLDWHERWAKLEQLVQPYRSQSTRNYDCIIPVSGAQDSYYIVHLVKDKLKMNPLLVTYNKYWNTPLGIANLANLRIRFNCDILIQNVNPLSVKKIVKSSLRQLGSIYWHCIAGQTVFPVQTAVRLKIPLIIWGAHQGMEQVGMFSHEHEVEMTRRYRKDHDLMGKEADDLLLDFDVLKEQDIWQYRYPDDEELTSVGVRGIYLSNYVRWDPKTQHELMIKLYGFQSATFSRTFDTYDFVDCYNYMDLHDQLKQNKHGITKVVDHACREIRHGRLTKEKAIGLVEYHQNQAPQNFDLFCDWLGVNERALEFVTDLYRNPDYWELDERRRWVSRLQVGSIEGGETRPRPDLGFVSNANFDLDRSRSYITVGKGWP